MQITEEFFRAFLDCKTKAYLKSSNEAQFESEIVEWKQNRLHNYRRECLEKLREGCKEGRYLTNEVLSSRVDINKYHLVIDCVWQTKELKSRIDAVEFLSVRKRSINSPSPIMFVPDAKITNNDWLQLAFDALVISDIYGKTPSLGKIIYGGEQKEVKVNLVDLISKASKIVTELIAQQTNLTRPQLVLNKHCPECQFQAYCHQTAIEKDELTLLSNMSEKERSKQHNKGIFSVTQLSYTFRVRRRSRHSASKEKYSFALKALAIREKKIYLVGEPKLVIKGTPVFLDVEGMPDQNSYYLIGLRIKNLDSSVQYSFWADIGDDEQKIWASVLQTLGKVDNPQLIHYGSYETMFLKRMKERYPEITARFPFVERVVTEAINLLSEIYARIYFPTYSNGLKEIGQYLGFQWSEHNVMGLNAIVWRWNWQFSKNPNLKQKLIVYNAEDCVALENITSAITKLCGNQVENNSHDIVQTDELKPENPYHFGNTSFLTPELTFINRAAYWNYQRNSVYIKSSKRLKRVYQDDMLIFIKSPPVSKVVTLDKHPLSCPKCEGEKLYKIGRKNKIVYDIKLTRNGIKRWVVKYCYHRYRCLKCKASFNIEERPWTKSKYGLDLQAYVIYQIIELRLSGRAVVRNLNQLFALNLNKSVIQMFKANFTEYYVGTVESILQNMMSGSLLHVDETRVNIKNKEAYVWVLTNLEEVIYFYTETREADKIKSLLQSFKGVLVTDFYAAYDSIDCPQQKCLVHLIRDFNDDLLKQPFNEELRGLVQDFTALLKPIIETIDRFGLKARFLRKHKKLVKRFSNHFFSRNYESEIANKYKKRFKKNFDKFFTFLDYDGVPWNNNNAETAIKAFARLRKSIEGPMSEKGIQEYLTLLSIRETCKYKGVNFLNFLRSRERDIDAFIQKHG